MKQYVGALIDRICELTIETKALQQILSHAGDMGVIHKWKEILELSHLSTDAQELRQAFAARRDSVLQSVDPTDVVKEMLKSRNLGLPR